MLDYHLEVTIVCLRCQVEHSMTDEHKVGTTGVIVTPCAMCGREGAGHDVFLVFNSTRTPPWNEDLVAYWEGK